MRKCFFHVLSLAFILAIAGSCRAADTDLFHAVQSELQASLHADQPHHSNLVSFRYSDGK